MAGGYEIGLSNSEAESNRVGGDFTVYGGGQKPNLTPYLIFGAVAVVILGLLVLFHRR